MTDRPTDLHLRLPLRPQPRSLLAPALLYVGNDCEDPLSAQIPLYAKVIMTRTASSASSSTPTTTSARRMAPRRVSASSACGNYRHTCPKSVSPTSNTHDLCLYLNTTHILQLRELPPECLPRRPLPRLQRR